MVRKRTLLLAAVVLVAGTGLAVASDAVDPSQCEPVDETENVTTAHLQNRTNASDHEGARRDIDEDQGIVLTGRTLVDLAMDVILDEAPCAARSPSNDSTATTPTTTTPTGSATATPTD